MPWSRWCNPAWKSTRLRRQHSWLLKSMTSLNAIYIWCESLWHGVSCLQICCSWWCCCWLLCICANWPPATVEVAAGSIIKVLVVEMNVVLTICCEVLWQGVKHSALHVNSYKVTLWSKGASHEINEVATADSKQGAQIYVLAWKEAWQRLQAFRV